MITVITKQPYSLLRRINEGIDKYEIQTWEYDSAGDYTYVSYQWRFRAWFRPIVTKGEKIEFLIVGNSRILPSRNDYAIYHGRFAEMLIAHFFKYFSKIEITPIPSRDDLMNSFRDED